VFLASEAGKLASGAVGWFPRGARARWVDFGRASSRVLAGYVRSRIIASLFIGVRFWVAFALLGLKQALLLAWPIPLNNRSGVSAS
jgi:predicted PurR-regulated permease PerM